VEHKDNFVTFIEDYVVKGLRQIVAVGYWFPYKSPLLVRFSTIRDVPRNDETSHHFFEAHDEDERVLDVRKLMAGNFLMEEQGMTIDNTLKNKSTLRFLPFYRLRHFSS
jgi:hypothetical protein